LLLTDYIEFRWYVNGERRRVVRLADITQDGKVKKSAIARLLLKNYLTISSNTNLKRSQVLGTWPSAWRA
jgi:hypothetical protein